MPVVCSNRMRRLIPIFIFLLIFVTACGKRGYDTTHLKPAATSRDALLQTLDALANRDEPSLLALVYGDADAQDFFRSIIASFKMFDDFRDKFTKVYGQEAWAEFQGSATNGEPAFKFDLPDFDKIKQEATNWEATVDNQGRFDSGFNVPFQLKKINGGWVINGDGLFNDKKTLRGMTKTQNVLIAFTKKYMKAIGHKGISARDIRYQMGKNLLREFMGGEFIEDGKPIITNRFDIDSIIEQDRATNGNKPARQ